MRPPKNIFMKKNKENKETTDVELSSEEDEAVIEAEVEPEAISAEICATEDANVLCETSADTDATLSSPEKALEEPVSESTEAEQPTASPELKEAQPPKTSGVGKTFQNCNVILYLSFTTFLCNF